jgi:ABC-type transport system involved in cytochrome c biogenesis permease subunit
MQTHKQPTPLTVLLILASAVVGVVILGLSYIVLVRPYVTASPAKEPEKVELAPYDVSPWRGLLVQHGGRPKPFESAATEAVRQITGRARFQGKDPVAVALSWIMQNGSDGGTQFTDWENYPFILCPYQELREAIYVDLLFNKFDPGANGYLKAPACKGLIRKHFRELDLDGDGRLTRDELQRGRDLVVAELTEEQRHGKYISPADLRGSLTLKGVVTEMEGEGEAEGVDEDLRKNAGEVAGRLMAFDRISQNPTLATRRRGMGLSGDPIHVVALDKVEGGPLFAIGDLKKCLDDYNSEARDSVAWRYILRERVRATPQLYVKPEHRKALEQFQEQIKAGTADRAIDQLEKDLQARRHKWDKMLEKARSLEDFHRFMLLVNTREERKRLGKLLRELQDFGGKNEERNDRIIAELKEILSERDRKVIDDLRRRAHQAARGKYHPEDQKFRMLHLGYLENRFPSLYEDSYAWQDFPRKDAREVLASFDRVKQAYRSSKADRFDQASRDFFDTVRTVSQRHAAYPGTMERNLFWVPVEFDMEEMMDFELTLNRVEPFQKAWIIMLFSIVLFIASMALPAGKAARVCYALAFVPYLAALGFQVFGFALRIIIAGRPPVSNLYETVVWVSFMSAVFALVLELIYRKRVIGLAGALVATVGLVLADQLSLTLDPRISPLLPVLRTNYWLTIHVLTIVSSYAGGTLAWGVGNISLAIIAFGQPRREVVKTLAQFTYRAMQIAVLLLAFGTFLGGMWAAESWGRFWGWDPKEVWALIALVCYVIPLHMRYIGWVKDFGLAVSAVLCYAAIVMSWYLFSALGGGGLHAYAMSGGGPVWVFWAGALNIEWVIIASLMYQRKKAAALGASPE